MFVGGHDSYYYILIDDDFTRERKREREKVEQGVRYIEKHIEETSKLINTINSRNVFTELSLSNLQYPPINVITVKDT